MSSSEKLRLRVTVGLGPAVDVDLGLTLGCCWCGGTFVLAAVRRLSGVSW
jgi:hypothetical protein